MSHGPLNFKTPVDKYAKTVVRVDQEPKWLARVAGSYQGKARNTIVREQQRAGSVLKLSGSTAMGGSLAEEMRRRKKERAARAESPTTRRRRERREENERRRKQKGKLQVMPYKSGYSERGLMGVMPDGTDRTKGRSDGWFETMYMKKKEKKKNRDDEDSDEDERKEQYVKPIIAFADGSREADEFCKMVQMKDLVGMKVTHQAGMCDLNALNSNGQAPLHIACEWSHDELVRWLLVVGADRKKKDSNGKTPIVVAQANYDEVKAFRGYHAKRQGWFHCVHLLKQQSIFRAAHSGDLERVKWLVEHGGTDPNFTNQYGMTALHLATVKGNVPVCEYLVEAGANPFQKNNVQQDALDMTTNKYLTEVLQAKKKIYDKKMESTKLGGERKLRARMVQKKILENQRVIYKGTTAGNRITRKLKEEYKDVPQNFKFSKSQLTDESEQAQPIPGKYEMWNMSSASKVPNTGEESRLRHATRYNGYKEKDKEFYLDYWPGAGSAKFAHWCRGAGWATRMRTLSHEGGHHTST